MTDMTDKTGITAEAGFAINNNPQPLNITFPDGSQLNFPVSGKASFSGDVEDSAKVFFDAVLRYRDVQLETERQQRQAAEKERDELRVWKKIAAGRYVKLQQLRAKLANPVLLPDAYSPSMRRGGQQSTSYRATMTYGGNWLHKDMVAEAIQEAGFTVKGGE